MSYPWGREAFSSTLERFGPDLGDPNPIAELKKQFCQRTSVWYGFPFVLQVQVLNSISSLCSRIKDLTDMRNFINRSSVDLGKTILLRESVVVEVECDANVSNVTFSHIFFFFFFCLYEKPFVSIFFPVVYWVHFDSLCRT